MNDSADKERALDDLRCPMAVIDPALQDPAYQLVERLRATAELSGW